MHKLKIYSSTFYLLLFCSIIHNKAFAQEKINIGEKISIHSELLDDTRELYISLPNSYSDTIHSPKHYPVLYFFDGDSHFENLVAQRNWLTRNLYATMPELILVGITQKDRAKELTPTHMETPADWKRADFSTTGGNGEFMAFIEIEVKPMIDKTYRTNGFEVLSGHSFGGLATMNCFVNTPDLYDAYIAIDPSMWWNNTTLLNTMDGDWISKDHKGKILFVAKANDPGSGEDHHNALLDLHKKLNALDATANFDWEYKFYDAEDHGSVVVPAEYDAYRFVFKGYQMPVKKIMKSPELLDAHYNEISERLGYTMIPDEALIEQLADVCIKQELYTQAEELLLKNSINYPKSTHAQLRYRDFVKMKY